MNITRVILAAIIAAVLPIAARAAAWDLRLQQYDASNRPREVVISPAANSLIGFSGTKALVNITPGPNITISNNTISATGGVADGDKGNITVAGDNWTIDPTGVTPSTYGNATHSPRLTVTADGRISLVEPIAIAPTNGVIKNSTFTAGQLVYIVNSTTGEIGSIPGATYNASNTTISLGNLAVGNMSVNAVSAPWSPSTGGTGSVNAHNIVTTSNASVGGTNTGDQNTFVRFKVSGQNDIIALTPTSNITINATGGLAATTNNTTGEITLSGAGISAGSMPGGIFALWPTADIASPPTGFFAAGQYGTEAGAALGGLSPIVRSLGDVATPTVDIAAGAVPAGTVVTMNTATLSAFHTATNNGTDPTYSVGTVGNTFTVSSGGTWEYRANKLGHVSSAVQSVAYTIDPVPTITAREINGTALTLTYSEAVSRGGSYSNAHFDLDMSTTGSNIPVTYVAGDGTNTHTYTAASAAVSGETVDLDFSGAANSIEETAGYNQDLAAIVSAAVTNSTSGGGITYIVEENFEGTGTPAGWFNSGGNFDQSTSGLSLEASEALALTGGAAQSNTPTGIAQGEVWVRYRVRFIEDGAGALLYFYDSGFGQRGLVYRQTGGALTVDSGGGSDTTVATTSINTTYWIWVHYKKGTGANGEMDVWFSSTSTKPADGSDNHATITGSTATADIDFLAFINTSGNVEHYIDEVRVAAASIP